MINKPEHPQTFQISNRIWRGVTLQLFLVAVLPLTVLVLIVTFGSLELHHEAMRSLVADRNLRAVQSAANSISKEIHHRGQILGFVSKDLQSDVELGENLAQIKDDLDVFDGGAAFIDSTGQFLYTSGSVAKLAETPDWDIVRTAALSSTPDTPQYLHPLSIDNQHYLPIVVTRLDKGFLIGLSSSETLLADGLSVISENEPVATLVIDQNHNTLYQIGNTNTKNGLTTRHWFHNPAEDTDGIDFYQADDGEHVITSSIIQPVEWTLMIDESWEDIAGPLLSLTQNAPLIAIPILIFSVFALWFGLHQIVQPIQALEMKARDLAHGNFETISQPVGGVPEIRHLQETLINMATQLNEAQNSLHSYVGAITESVENERRNLARELHDDTLQSMIALGQYTQYALHWNKDPQVEKPLDQVMSLADHGMKNLRRLVQGLRPIYIEDLGLATALAMQAKNTGQLEIHFQMEGVEQRLKPEIEMALYRIAQEALSNVSRHAGATNAWISLYFNNDNVVLEIRDDGQGFDLPSDPIYYARMGHYGLLSLYERSELIGAKLAIQSSADEGTRILVRLDYVEKTKL